MIKSFEEFVNEKYDYSVDDIPVGKPYKNIPEIDNKVGGGGGFLYKEIMDDFENSDEKEMVASDEQYNFEIWKVKGNYAYFWFVKKIDRMVRKSAIFRIDGEFTFSAPINVGEIEIYFGTEHRKDSGRIIYTFDTESGELTKAKFSTADKSWFNRKGIDWKKFDN